MMQDLVLFTFLFTSPEPNVNTDHRRLEKTRQSDVQRVKMRDSELNSNLEFNLKY